MKRNKLIICTNAKGSQIESNETHYKLKGIPITANASVMNGVYYSKEENEKGMPTMVGKPFTIDHPADENGNFISAMEGNGLMDYFSGGVVTNVYEVNDVWYADAEIKKSLLAAQTNGDKLQSKLDKKEDLGVSTGLYFSQNTISGANDDGVKYTRSAINQQFNHLAAVDDPAGGKETTAVFNSENTFVCNFEMPEVETDGKQEDKTESIINRALTAFAKRLGISYNSQEFDNQDEDYAMRKTIEAKLQAAGIEVNGLDDNALLEAYNKLNAPQEPEQKPQTNSEDTPAWAKDLVAKVNSLESQLTANANKELDALVADVVDLKINGIDEEVAKTMGVNALKGLLAANGAEYVAAGYGGPQSRTTQTNSDDGEYRSQKPGIEE